MNFDEMSLIYPNVVFDGDYTLGPFVIIGHPSLNHPDSDIETLLGAGAIIRSHTVIYCGNQIGRGFRTGHGVLIREENEIGDDVSIGSGSIVEHHVRIGHGVRLHSNVFVPEFTVLEDGCWLGPNVVVTNARYPRSPTVKEALAGAYVERGAKIGANATLLPGVRIGHDALVGAGAVVTKDVPAGAVVVGNPSRTINHISRLPY
jgi:acetyltransferase-like isoleucine patch superfamily enzyme